MKKKNHECFADKVNMNVLFTLEKSEFFRTENNTIQQYKYNNNVYVLINKTLLSTTTNLMQRGND